MVQESNLAIHQKGDSVTLHSVGQLRHKFHSSVGTNYGGGTHRTRYEGIRRLGPKDS